MIIKQIEKILFYELMHTTILRLYVVWSHNRAAREVHKTFTVPLGFYTEEY